MTTTLGRFGDPYSPIIQSNSRDCTPEDTIIHSSNSGKKLSTIMQKLFLASAMIKIITSFLSPANTQEK